MGNNKYSYKPNKTNYDFNRLFSNSKDYDNNKEDPNIITGYNINNINLSYDNINPTHSNTKYYNNIKPEGESVMQSHAQPRLADTPKQKPRMEPTPTPVYVRTPENHYQEYYKNKTMTLTVDIIETLNVLKGQGYSVKSVGQMALSEYIGKNHKDAYEIALQMLELKNKK